jgi:hypothetical protein
MTQRLLAFLILFTACTLPAAASNGNDRVHFGTDIVVPAGESVGDVVCFLCSVEAKGEVTGDIVVFLGSVHLDEHANGSAVIFAGDLYLGSNATIARDLVIFGGVLHGDEGSGNGGERVIFPPVIFVPIFLVIAAIFWGIWMLFRWLFFRNRQVYPPVPYPPVRR